MSHYVVKILSNDSGEKREKRVWCYVAEFAGGNATLCGAEYFGIGESGCEYKMKKVDRGGITCSECLAIIKEHKKIML